MKDSYEQRIQNQFGGFCVKVLKNEARYIQREYARRREQEKSLDELILNTLLVGVFHSFTSLRTAGVAGW